MKRRIIAFLLVCMMIIPTVFMSSCSEEVELTDVAAKVYTLYMTCKPGTTEESIKQVELALNRLTFYQLGLCVKLIMIEENDGDQPDAEYNEYIDNVLASCQAYNDEKTNKSKNKTKTSEASSEASAEESIDVMTGDDYIDLLAAGGTYELEHPRCDIFLVNGYDRYIDLVGKNLLAALDEKLKSEAKTIRDYVFPTFLSAAKVINAKGNQKTYGVPMNKGIGEYSYIVFDKEYLEKYSIDAGTMNNLEDLEYYLEKIKDNEPDVVPLVNVFDDPNTAYLFANGFPAYIKDGVYVMDAYPHNPEDTSKSDTLNYFTLISRYNAYGYIGEETPNKRWAVKFINGTFEDLEALAASTGREYDYSIHSYPVANNEDLLSSLFCISSYTVSSELTDVSRLLAFLETNSEAANLLAFGVQGENYMLDDNNQVVRLNNDYMMDIGKIGNAFLTYTMAGENPNKWRLLMDQNLDSSKTADQSVSVGFAYYPAAVADPNNSSITYSEPNYVNIIKSFCDKFYPDIIKGTFIDLSYQDLKDAVSPMINDSKLEEIRNRYIAAVDAEVHDEQAAVYAEGSYKYNDVLRQVDSQTYDGTYNKAKYKNPLKREVRDAIAAEHPEYDSKTLDAEVAKICTDAWYEEKIRAQYGDKIEQAVMQRMPKEIDKLVDKNIKAYKEEDKYTKRIEAALNSAECVAELNAITSLDVFVAYPDAAIENANNYILGLMKEKLGDEFEKINEALRKAYKEFVKSYIDRFNFDNEETRSDPDYRTAIVYCINKAKKGSTKLINLLKTELRKIVTAEMGEDALAQDISDTTDDRFNDKWKQDVVIETFKRNADPNFELKTANEAIVEIVNQYLDTKTVKAMYEDVLLASLEKALKLINTIEVDTGIEKEETSESGGTTPEESKLVDIETADLYSIIFEKRIQAQFYEFKPLPTV